MGHLKTTAFFFGTGMGGVFKIRIFFFYLEVLVGHGPGVTIVNRVSLCGRGKEEETECQD